MAKILIIGNCHSEMTALAKAWSQKHAIPLLQKLEVPAEGHWIMEALNLQHLESVLPKADTLLFLNFAHEQAETDVNQNELLVHQRKLFERFDGHKIEVVDRASVEAFLRYFPAK